MKSLGFALKNHSGFSETAAGKPTAFILGLPSVLKLV